VLAVILKTVNGIVAMGAIVSAAYAVLLHIVSVIKRMLCFLHITRRRKKSGNILPLHADVKIQSSLPSNDVSSYFFLL